MIINSYYPGGGSYLGSQNPSPKSENLDLGPSLMYSLAPKPLIISSVRTSSNYLVDNVVEHKKRVIPMIQLIILGLERQEKVLILFQILKALMRQPYHAPGVVKGSISSHHLLSIY